MTFVADPAVTALLECLSDLPPMRAPLVVGDASGRIGAALRVEGATPSAWLREHRSGSTTHARPWPETHPHDAAFIRLPKAKDALAMALHASAAMLPPEAPIVVFGANDEGIRSASRQMADVADGEETVRVKHHARVLVGRRRATISGLRANLSEWRATTRLSLAGRERSWVSYPGTFAKGGLDAGTALLIAHLPLLRSGARVLDFAAGTGVVAAAFAVTSPGVALTLLERDAVALEAARENVPAARPVPGDSLAAVAGQKFDLIVSNPPLHEGRTETHAVLHALIETAPKYLAPGGSLLVVVQHRVPVLKLVEAAFKGAASIIADDRRFTVCVGRNEPRPG
jgi:16S rRNA (guanine1207-N2)-methyltransferase